MAYNLLFLLFSLAAFFQSIYSCEHSPSTDDSSHSSSSAASSSSIQSSPLESPDLSAPIRRRLPSIPSCPDDLTRKIAGLATQIDELKHECIRQSSTLQIIIDTLADVRCGQRAIFQKLDQCTSEFKGLSSSAHYREAGQASIARQVGLLQDLLHEASTQSFAFQKFFFTEQTAAPPAAIAPAAPQRVSTTDAISQKRLRPSTEPAIDETHSSVEEVSQNDDDSENTDENTDRQAGESSNAEEEEDEAAETSEAHEDTDDEKPLSWPVISGKCHALSTPEKQLRLMTQHIESLQRQTNNTEDSDNLNRSFLLKTSILLNLRRKDMKYLSKALACFENLRETMFVTSALGKYRQCKQQLEALLTQDQTKRQRTI